MSNKVFGVDLGTGNSAVAVIINGRPEVIANDEGSRTTPSVVFIKDGERKVGSSAKRGMVTYPKNTISFNKRFMGANYTDPDVQKMLNMITFDVVNKNNKPYISIPNTDGSIKEYSPEQVSSLVLEKMQKIAQDYYGPNEVVKDVVITVPAWFNDVQRQATKTAGELAGLNVLRIINEPTAAILASNIDEKTAKNKIVLVNDLGCGTEDVSICEVSDGMIEVLASYGDVFLGGQNYDDAIVRWMVEDFKSLHNGYDLSKDTIAYPRLVEAAEQAKIALSNQTQTEINLPYIAMIDGAPIMYSPTLTRAKFEALTADITKRVGECAKEALKKAGKTASDIDNVLLIGGSSRIPSVQKELADIFGDEKLDKHSNFDEAVALGAAIQANVCAGGEGSEDAVLLLDVTPISLGIEVNGNMMSKLIEANTTIPVKKSQVFTTAADNQPAVSIVVLQGERPMSADNKHIGNFTLDGIMPAPRGVPQIEVTFDINTDGILSVSAKDLGTQKEQHITINNSGALSQEEIDKIKADAEAFRAEDERKMNEVKAINEAEAFGLGVKAVLDQPEMKEKLTEEEVNTLTPLIEALEEKVKTKNLDDIKAAQNALEEAWKPIVMKLYPQQTPDGSATTGDAEANPFDGASENPFNL